MNDCPPDHAPEEGLVSARFKEERERIGLAPKELSIKLSVGLQRINWLESPAGNLLEKIKPVQWKCMALLGMDIQFIMIGKRSVLLSEQERALLENYRAISSENQDHLEAVSTAFKEQEVNFLLSKGLVCDLQ